jgi:hypothetical protein
MTQKITTHNLGFPRIGGDRERKKAQEAYWRGEINQAQLEDLGRELRKTARTDHALVHIGSFPQTEHIRQTPSEFKQGKINSMKYENRIRRNLRIALPNKNSWILMYWCAAKPSETTWWNMLVSN